jgi:hypothetical protein
LTLPNSTIQNLQNDFAISINPFFSKFAELHFFAGEAGKSGFKSIDWARLNKADYYNSPTFLKRGVKGNGTSSYADLNFDADTETTIDSLTYGFFAPDEIISSNSDISMMGGTDSSLQGISFVIRKTNFGIRLACNSDRGSIANLTKVKNLSSFSSDGSSITYREDEVTLGTKNVGTQFKSSTSVILMATSKNGNLEDFTEGLISLSFITNTELTVSELGILSTAIKTYLNAI